ncbi:hypothetical protein F5884DRAFT_178791 [Xylogone sp. PMI_703]|nr:hypothetical protein F5884DRAFT_178791 [Xylogone sp. PMI_703]
MEQVDLVVIGAGFNGLAAAKTYLGLNPRSKVLVLDSASSVGGVWAKHRLYPGLKSNNMLGTYEFSDFPMSTEIYGVKPGEFIPGTVVHRYLNDYTDRFIGKERLRLETRIESVEHIEGGGWILTLLSGFSDREALTESKLQTKKLIVATGMNSEAYLPNFVGSESFGAPLFHPKDFLRYADTLKSAKNVCVFGGGKSAWDVVYEYASKGIQVDWVIRKSGHGPTWMSPPYVTPLKKWLEKLVHTRLLTWFSPCIFGEADGYSAVRSFFHGTRIGRFIVDTFWGILGNDVKTLNKFDAHPETKKLTPWSNPFFIAAGLSILNYPTDFFDLVRNGTVRVHIDEIVSLSPNAVHLASGTRLPADAFISASGWKHSPTLKFLPPTLDFGLPHKLNESEAQLVSTADKEILSRFPRLRAQSKRSPDFKLLPEARGVSRSKNEAEDNFGSYHLYRYMIPPSLVRDRDIAFAGSIMTISTTVIAQTQALWISAYFSSSSASLLPMETKPEDIEYSAILHNRFGKWRYPEGYGEKFPDMVFDALPYVDLLLQDLGLQRWRKGSALAEIFQPYGPEDYKGLVMEWVESRRGKA